MRNSEIKAALRTFHREKAYAIINLSGLSLAIACCLILSLYLKSELTYDLHNTRHKEIYRVVNEFSEASGSSETFAFTSHLLGPMLKQNYPDVVKDYTRFVPTTFSRRPVLIRSEGKSLFWTNVYYADANVFDIFTHKILYGDPKTALKDRSSAAVSETFARRNFGDVNPIGKTINAEIVPAIPRKITLVFRDLPDNTHLKYDVLFSQSTYSGSDDSLNSLWGIDYFTYLVMPENYSPGNFKAVSDSFFSRFMESRGKQTKSSWRCWVEPLADIHLHSEVAQDLPRGNPYYIYGFTAVALFILLVACINYVNLAIARAARRAKEIGMRKILGVSRFVLMFRFLSEAMLFSLIAMFFGVALVEVALKLTSVSDLLGKQLSLDFAREPVLMLWTLGVSLLIGFLSGLYPAVYLSSISSLSALTGTYGKNSGSFRLREFLVLMQFTVSVVVIACTLIMAMQMRYIARKPLGFEKQNRVIINLRGLSVVERYPVVKAELLKNRDILGVTACQFMMGIQDFPNNSTFVDNKEGVPEAFGFIHTDVADNFLDVMGMKLVAGRSFSQRLLTDVGATYIVNEAMVQKRGWANPIGKRIMGVGPSGPGKVIGVVKDFHPGSLRNSVAPFALYPFNDNFQNASPAMQNAFQRILVVHISEKNVQPTLRFLQEKLAAFDPSHPFEYQFLDDAIDRIYFSEDRLMKMTGVFSGICIFISCLGLFGLAAFTTEQRSKEIGIRKVLGASASQIILMLARKTLWLVLAGSIFASIIAYYAIDEWLSGFAYRVGIDVLVFVAAAALVIAVAFMTVALQSYRAAQSNPALMIRYE